MGREPPASIGHFAFKVSDHAVMPYLLLLQKYSLHLHSALALPLLELE